MLTESEVRQRLKTVIDPEIGIDIVEMGLIYEIHVDPGEKSSHGIVHLCYTLTTPACPLADLIVERIEAAFADLPGFEPRRDLLLELTFDPPWNIDRLSEAAKAELGF